MKSKKILLILLSSIVVIICGCLIFLMSPYGQCVGIFSGHVPQTARDQLISRFVTAIVDEDEETLIALNNEAFAANMRELQPQPSKQYEVTFVDSLGGLYEYRVNFDSGLELYVTVYGTWPTCPDFNVTEEEIMQNLSISAVQNVIEP